MMNYADAPDTIKCPECGSNRIRVTESLDEVIACFECDTVFGTDE